MLITNPKPFDDCLKRLNEGSGAPAPEINAAAITFERLITARAICRSAIGETFQESSLIEIFKSLSDLAHAPPHKPNGNITCQV